MKVTVALAVAPQPADSPVKVLLQTTPLHSSLAVAPALASEMGWSAGDSVAVTSGSRRAWLVVGALVEIDCIARRPEGGDG